MNRQAKKHNVTKFFIPIIIFLALTAINQNCSHSENPEPISLTSSAFSEGEMIPVKYTCDGEDISPPLSWGQIPQNTQSLALICDDPDAPHGTFVHWVIYDIPSTETSLVEGIPPYEILPNGAKQGQNDFKNIGYGGPCPPPGDSHRYFFKLYALDSPSNLESGATKKQLENAMKGHILGEGELMGQYKR